MNTSRVCFKCSCAFVARANFYRARLIFARLKLTPLVVYFSKNEILIQKLKSKIKAESHLNMFSMLTTVELPTNPRVKILNPKPARHRMGVVIFAMHPLNPIEEAST